MNRSSRLLLTITLMITVFSLAQNVVAADRDKRPLGDNSRFHERVLSNLKKNNTCFYSSKSKDGTLRLVFLEKPKSIGPLETALEIQCGERTTLSCNWGQRWYEQCCTDTSTHETICKRWAEPDKQCE